MSGEVTDPRLIEELERRSRATAPKARRGGEVTDPNLIARLESMSSGTQQPQPQQEQGGVLDAFGRQLGLTGRAIAGGAAQAVEPLTEPIRYLMNKVLPGNPVGNIEQATDNVLTDIGVPEPQGLVEQGVQSVGRFVTAAGLGYGGEKAIEAGIDAATGLAKRGPGVVDVRHGTWADKPEALSTDQLHEAASASYKAADDAGLVIHPGSFKHFVDEVVGTTKAAGIDKGIHPKATAAIRRLTEAVDSGEPIPLAEMEILRRVTQGARASIEPDERRIGQIITAKMDDYLAGLGQNDTLAGDPQAAIAALNNARNLWSRMSKSNVVQEAVEKAGIRAGQFSGSGFENALRTQFRQIAMNTKKMRGFSAAEKKAIKKAASGGPIDNAFRYLGKLAPTGVISAGIGSSGGYAMAGPVGAATVPAVGTLSRLAATKSTQRNVEKLGDLVRRGEKPAEGVPDWLLPWLSGGIFGADTQE